MLQRIQSVYLLLAVITQLCFNFFTIAVFEKSNLSWTVMPYSLEGEELTGVPTYFIVFGAVAVNLLAALTAFMMFRFNNRTLQIRLGHVVYFSLLAITVAMYFYLGSAKDFLDQAYANVKVEYAIGSFLPVVAIAFIILANRAIRKDEKLVRSLDRIR